MSEATATPQPVLADLDDFLAWVEGQRERYGSVGSRLVIQIERQDTALALDAL